MFRNISKLYASITPIIIPELKKYSDDIKKHNQENDHGSVIKEMFII